MKALLVTIVITLSGSYGFAQSEQTTAATPAGHEVTAGIGGYTYREPGANAISIHGPKFTAGYTGTWSLNERRHWFAQADAGGTAGSATYDGWCSPWLITPDPQSPNGYALDLGDPSTCSESGDRDWYVEARALAGKDVIAGQWAWSPYSGIGLRHVSNGTAGVPGFRTDNYLYVPLGLTARTTISSSSQRTLSLNVEFDVLAHGWQRTRNSALGGGDVPATPTAPAFTIEGLSDVAFSQSRGWALRVSGRYPLSRFAVEPYYSRWQVRASPVNYETATFTVNGVTAREQLGFYEPFNTTSELGVRLGFHF